ncbi:MAG: DNA topoisomerase I, partial [Prevotella sp.]|nr:DNA topoisomerase I [Prevotella sp.]
LSPVLWRKVKPALSAGRVQSVAVRLIVEREREMQAFKSEPYYRISAVFTIHNPKNGEMEVKAELDTRFKTHEEALAFLEKCKDASFVVDTVSKKPVKRTPAPPFTTSTLQQEAARKLGFSVSQTMMVAQRLYENGFITYMRTDSVNLSKLCLSTSKEEVTKLYGKEYSQTRNFHTKTKGAQEAHEAIRPTDMKSMEINGTAQEKRLYELIWKRTAASQMADAQMEKTTTEILIQHPTFGTMENKFVANGEVITFDGFLKVYRESTEDDENGQEEFSNVLPEMKKGDVLARQEINAIERFSQGPTRYSEASLVHKLEELGIGRPSTYAPTISTIQQREYVQKGEKKSEERTYSIDVLKGNKISSKEKKEMVGSEKGKLLPTDIGTVVNDFLMENFPDIMDYHFTANIEEEFDSIAAGKSEWEKVIKDFYKDFEPEVEGVLKSRSEHKAGEREIGIDPKSGRPIYAKIGRFGPVIQIGAADDSVKPQFAQIPADKSMETITVEEALELFKLPRTLGELEGMPVVVGTGKFGPYIMHNRKFVSL